MSDRDALIALYHATDGPNWTNNTNWLSEKPLREWYGIGTDSDGRVTEVELSENRLTGIIPREIGRLNNLRSFYLVNNQLTGSIPPEIGQLSDLVYFGLSHNQLTGVIPPEIGRLVNLSALYLADNQLTGSIPPEIGKLRNLVHLLLFENQLSGQVPPEIGMLTDLTFLGLSNNNMTGPIPRELIHIPLEILSLTGTKLCVPSDDAFTAWLEAIEEKNGITRCEEVSEELSDRDVLIEF